MYKNNLHKADLTIIDYFAFIVWIWIDARRLFYSLLPRGRSGPHWRPPACLSRRGWGQARCQCRGGLRQAPGEIKTLSWWSLWLWSLWSLPRPGWSAGAGSHGAAPCCTAAAARGQQSKPGVKRNITGCNNFLSFCCLYILKLKLVSSKVFLVLYGQIKPQHDLCAWCVQHTSPLIMISKIHTVPLSKTQRSFFSV